MWENALNFGTGFTNNLDTISKATTIGSSVLGAYNGYQANKLARSELDLSRNSYYRNVLREDKEDSAINNASKNIGL